ncbi:hypothetical protein R0137_06650 [Congregibacter brevis]|uniref:Outer membrane protein beta-barrel domain-containing protein n=1 Tax=Congregibacter brevis TaxID=3081201 RepID=A0ABZ0IFD6_9GAMM|nr:hypothetical protein R0137_06650 [Congregibacter sp. IMCC45268]
MKVTSLIQSVLATLFVTTAAFAEPSPQSAAHSNVHESAEHEGAESGPEHHESHGYPHHTLGVFLGDTTETRRNQGLTLGLEYEYRASERFGVGAILEHVGGDFDTNIAVLPVAYHRGPWKVYAGPGVEDSEEEGSTFLVRLGLEYGFHFGKYEVSPQIDVDFVDDEQLFIFGVVIARPF